MLRGSRARVIIGHQFISMGQLNVLSPNGAVFGMLGFLSRAFDSLTLQFLKSEMEMQCFIRKFLPVVNQGPPPFGILFVTICRNEFTPFNTSSGV